MTEKGYCVVYNVLSPEFHILVYSNVQEFSIMLSCLAYDIADVTEVLCELELTIKRVKVSPTPDGRVMDLFFITDSR